MLAFPLRLGAAALVAVWLVPLSARAALFDDEEARRRIEQTNLRLAQVQKQLEDRIAALELQLKSQGLVELFSQVEQLKSDVARLRGQIEVLNHEQEQPQKRQRDLYIDLDSRLRRLEGGPGANVPPAASAAPAPGPAAAAPLRRVRRRPRRRHQAPRRDPRPLRPAPALPTRRRSSSAPTTSRSTSSRPATTPRPSRASTRSSRTTRKSPLAPSAYYWIGNSQFALKDYRAAIATQRQLVAAFPGNPKVPDALLNIATSQFELGDGAASRRTLEELIAKYPQSEAAVKARQRLAIR